MMRMMMITSDPRSQVSGPMWTVVGGRNFNPLPVTPDHTHRGFSSGYIKFGHVIVICQCQLRIMFHLLGECLSCYECPESASWSQCTSHQEARYCEPGWRCVTMQEKPKGKPKYHRRTCSEESVCSEFCKDKEDCEYNCCNNDLCNGGGIWRNS